MPTEEMNISKKCLFCASDYHLEMILLPYIKKRIEQSKFVIMTQNNLEETIEILKDRLNIQDDFREKINNINWKNDDENKLNDIKKFILGEENINIVINGEYDYIRNINNLLKEIVNENVNIIDCFHVGDPNIDISEMSKKYDCILNTEKL